MSLSTKITVGLIFGLFVGIFFPDESAYLKPIGTLFLNFLKMGVMPLVFLSLVGSITFFRDIGELKRVGIKTFSWFLILTVSAGVLALGVGHSFCGEAYFLGSKFSFFNFLSLVLNQLIEAVPYNPFLAFIDGNILQVVVLSLVFSIALVLVGKDADPLLVVFRSAEKVVFKLISLVIAMSPYGIFALVAAEFSKLGGALLYLIAGFFGAILIASVLHVVFVYGGILLFKVRGNPIAVLYKVWDIAVIASSTTSASAALPTGLRVAKQRLGISDKIAGFVLPLGSVSNKGGTVIFQVLASFFIAHFYHIPLSIDHEIIIVLTAVMSSFGTPSVSGAGILILTAILNSVGLPVEGLALIVGVDRIFDMIRTPINVIGDSVVAIVVAVSEKEVDHSLLKA